MQLIIDDRIVQIDDEDYPLVSFFTWRIANYGKREYVVTGEQTIYLHKLILRFPNKIVDHISGDTLDCRKNNLRYVSYSENAANTFSRKGSSKYKGVFWSKARKKWIAQIKVNYVKYDLGGYVCEEAAAKAYDNEARKHFGEFGRYNFPEENERSALVNAQLQTRNH